MRFPEEPDDFRVEEIPLFEPTGEGEHTYLFVEKRMLTTEAVARELARVAGVRSRDVGYAGRKDRNAVARQWFSVPAFAPEEAARLELPGFAVLAARRHRHKLRVGRLAGNRFDLRVRDVQASDEALALAIALLRDSGVPNRFGPQRFGRDGQNAARGLAILRGEAPRGDRRAARFLLSALQSAVFNEVLARRPTPLDRLDLGDVAQVHPSGGLFLVEDAAVENERAARFEISPTGPIFGSRVLSPDGEPAARESEVLRRWGVPATEAFRLPPGLALRGARRALRVRADGLEFEREDAATVRLRFGLPAGSYATVLFEELRATLANPALSGQEEP